MTRFCAWLFVSLVLVTAPTAPASAAPLASASAPASPRPLPLASEGRSSLPLRARPSASEAPVLACSFVAPVCVHGPEGARGELLLRALASAERWFRAMDALRYPRPLADDDGLYDLYVLPNLSAAQTVADGIATGSSFDQSSAFTLLPLPDLQSGCSYDLALFRALLHATLLRYDAGAEGSAIAMLSSYLGSVLLHCYVEEDAAIDEFQRDPERPLLHGEPDAEAGSLLFGQYLDEHYGAGAPGSVLLGLYAVAAQQTPSDQLHFWNEPDLLDALRSNARAREKPFEDLLLDFAVSRAFVGSRSDGAHLSDVRKYGSFGRPRVEWAIPWSSLPRRLAPMRPIETLGSTYLWIDLTGAPEDGELGFVADWELGVLFHWALVKVDAEGAEAGRVNISGINGATHAERTLIGFKGLSGILIVGTNVGSIDRSHPADPDETSAPRGYTLFLVK